MMQSVGAGLSGGRLRLHLSPAEDEQPITGHGHVVDGTRVGCHGTRGGTRSRLNSLASLMCAEAW